jgi:hypothetical protein
VPPSPFPDERVALVELERLEAEHRELSASVELARKTLADRRLQGGAPPERPSNLAQAVILLAIVFAFLATGARILSRQNQRETDQAARSL